MRYRTRDIDWREIAINMALVAFSVLLVLAVLEGALRAGVLSTGDGFETEMCTGEQISVFHPTYGWALAPGTEYTQKRSRDDDWERFTHNARGLHDTFDSGAGTVVVLGDSFTYGTLVGDNSTFAYYLDKANPDTRFINHGVSQYGTTQEMLLYRDIANRTTHKAVVLAYYFGNDAQNNVEDSPRRPQFSYANGSLTLVRSPVNKSASTAERLYRNPTAWERVKATLRKHTATYDYLAPRLKTLLFAVGARELPSPPDGEARERQLRVTRAAVSEIAETAARNNATLIIAGIPTRGEIDPANPVRYDPEEGAAYWQAQREILRGVAANNSNIRFLNLEPIFHENGGATLYGTVDPHLQERGHAVTAAAIQRRFFGGETSIQGLLDSTDDPSKCTDRP